MAGEPRRRRFRNTTGSENKGDRGIEKRNMKPSNRNVKWQGNPKMQNDNNKFVK